MNLDGTEDELIEQWEAAKRTEEAWRKERITLEQEVTRRLAKPEDHQGTAKFGKLSVSYGLSRKVDPKALQDAAKSANIPAARLGVLFRWKPELNALEWAEASEEEKAALSVAIESEPRKPTVSVRKTKKENKE